MESLFVFERRKHGDAVSFWSCAWSWKHSGSNEADFACGMLVTAY